MSFRNAHLLMLMSVVWVLLSACGSADPGVLEPEPALPVLEDAAAEQPAAESPGYPVPEIVAPPTPTFSPDYPAPPTLAPTVDPYPGGLVWIIRPVGIQCEEGASPGYGDLRETTSTLTAAGVTVAGAEMAELMVATSCGSPTSAHFRVQIAAEDLQTSLSMDWTQE